MRRLHNPVRHYPWGSTGDIPRLLGREPDGRPHAELWIGAHPTGSSRLDANPCGERLDGAIEARPQLMLGEAVTARFGPRLPFLMKILAASAPLSLQVHPDAEQARAGFAAEEAAGIGRDSPHRRYRDPFHKPELLVALEPFEALCGFRPPGEAAADLHGLPGALAAALRGALAAPQPRRALRLALARLLALRGFDPRGYTDEFVAACARTVQRGRAAEAVRTVVRLAALHPGDPGVAAAVLLHRLHLAPGEALAVAPGTPHAHLSGVGVEVMAASDNVVRAGLTGKYVDTAELLRTARFEESPPPRIAPRRDGEGLHYRSGCEDFALRLLDERSPRTQLSGLAPAVVLALDGGALLRSLSAELKLGRGQAAFVAAEDGPVTVESDGRAAVTTVGPVP